MTAQISLSVSLNLLHLIYSFLISTTPSPNTSFQAKSQPKDTKSNTSHKYDNPTLSQTVHFRLGLIIS